MGKNKYTFQRGWGLTETLLTLGAISIMSVAIYTVFKPTDASAQVRIEQDNLRDISRNIDRSLGLLGSFEGLSTAKVDQDGLAPSRMKRSGDQLQTYWGTPVAIQPYQNPAKGVSSNTAFSVVYPQTPSEVCAGLASAMGRDAFDILVNGESVYDVDGMNPSMAAQRCANGNATMEFVFHSGLVSGQAVAAPPLVLPPAPPSVSPPPSSPPVMGIPENPGVDDATPGTLPAPPASSASPPPAPPPLTAPPSPTPPAPITYSPPPPVPVTPPGTQCVVPASWVESRYQSPHCASGQYGQRHQQSDRDVTYNCSTYRPDGTMVEEYSAWASPNEVRKPWSSWYDTTNTCTSCPTLAPQVEYQWPTFTGSCPSGQLGTVSHEYEQSRSRTRTHVCPAGTLTLPSITYGDWSDWANTGNTRNPINTCEDICVVPSPNPETEREEGTASRTQACPSGQIGEIKQERPHYRTRTRTWSCPNPTGPAAATSWSTWSGWTQYGSWVTISNTCVTECVAPPTTTVNITRPAPKETRAFTDCPAGRYGQNTRERTREERGTRTTSWSCPSPTGAPQSTVTESWSGTYNNGSWTLVSSTCTACGTPTPQTRLNWQNRSSACPSGQTGSITWQEQRNQSQSGTYNCPAGTLNRPAPTWSGTWVNGSWTGNKRNENNTCIPEGPPPNNGICPSRPMVTGCATYSVSTRTRVTAISIGQDNGAIFSTPGQYVRCTLGYADTIAADGFPSIDGENSRYRFVDRGGCGMNDWESEYGIPEECSSYVRVYAKNADGTNGQQCFGEAKIIFNWDSK